MYNLKLTAYATGAGFILSILAGIIFGVSFGTILIRAFFCGLLFGVVELTGYVLYKKYLNSDQELSSSDSDGDQKKETKGTLVDIVLDDTPLPDEESAPDFIIEKKGKSKVSSVSNLESVEDAQVISSDQSEKEPAFMAQSIDAVAKSYGNEKITNAEETTNESEIVGDENEIGSLQDLPDIENVMGDISSDFEDVDSSNITEDSYFATTGDSKPKTEVKTDLSSVNTEELSKAIRTVMARDN